MPVRVLNLHYKTTRYIALFFLAIVASLFASITLTQTTHASSFNAGNIMSDTVFTNKNSMSVQQIQSFLNSKVANCDTWGTQPSEFGGGTRRQWAEARGHSAPFTCLKDYTEGGKSSAQIIYDAGQEFSINPQVLIVLLQKEQSLVTDTWPVGTQYRSATGYGCPDTAPCDSQYYGLTNQLRWASRMFRAISNATPTWYTPYVLGSNFIRYSPDASCGGSQVTIQNRATQALYNYTPYQPNQGALDAGWGTAYCGAYGNRNFHLYFTSWFGSTQDNSPLVSSAVTTSTTSAGVGQPIYVSYTIRNPNNFPVVLPTVGVSNRLDGSFYDFNITTNVSFAANETKTFNGVFFPGATGTYKMAVTYSYGSSWWAGNSTDVRVEKPTLSVSSPLSVSPEYPLVGSPHSVAFTIKNTGAVEAHLTYVMAANTSDNVNMGYEAKNIVIIQPGQSYTYTTSRTASNTAKQKAWVSYMLPTGEWVSLGSQTDFRSYASPAATEISKPLASTPKNPLTNTTTAAEFTIKNTGDQPKAYKLVGIAVERKSDGQRFDFPSKPVTIAGNSEYTFKSDRSLPTKDEYQYTLTGTTDGTNWSTAVVGEKSSTSTKTTTVNTFNTAANLQVTSPLVSSIKRQGELTQLSYTVKNSGDQPADSVSIAYYCRFNGTSYCDIPGDTVTLNHNQEHTVTRTVSFTTPGVYTIKPLRYQNGVWTEYGNPVSITIQSYNPAASDFTAGVQINKNSINLGESVTATYTLRNNTTQDLQIPRFAVASRLGGFHDFGFQDWFFIKAGETLTFSSSFKPTVKGTYTLFPVMLLNGNWLGYNQIQLTVL